MYVEVGQFTKLEHVTKAVDKFRNELLFEANFDSNNMPTLAQLHFVKALDYLSLAVGELKMGALIENAAIVESNDGK